jgi:hypothetical protein
LLVLGREKPAEKVSHVSPGLTFSIVLVGELCDVLRADEQEQESEAFIVFPYLRQIIRK